MEVAMLFLAMVSGIMQGIQTWNEFRDRDKARKAQEEEFIRVLQSPEIHQRAELLLKIVPKKTLDLLRRRLQKCFDRFDEMLENDDEFFPQDVSDAAEKALPNCVCRVLKMIIDVNGSLPDQKLQEAWQAYSCESRTNP